MVRNGGRLKIAIVERTCELQDTLSLLAVPNDQFEISGAFANAEEALEELPYVNPDILLTATDLPGMDGIEITRKLKQLMPSVNVIIFTSDESRGSVYEAFCAGAVGYLIKNKNSCRKYLVRAIEEVVAGGAPMSAKIARMVVDSFCHKTVKSPLTEREAQVMRKLCEGRSYKSISDFLNISLATVKYHITNIYIKLQVTNKEDAIARARKEQYI